MKSPGLFLTALMLFSTVCTADSPQPIDLRGDRLELDIEGGFQVFSGNVSLVQGDLSIHADKIQVETRKGAIVKLSGSGKPLLLENLSAALEPMRAQAQTVEYETRKWTLVLSGNVLLVTSGWEARSHIANYDLRRKLVTLIGTETDQIHIRFLRNLFTR